MSEGGGVPEEREFVSAEFQLPTDVDVDVLSDVIQSTLQNLPLG